MALIQKRRSYRTLLMLVIVGGALAALLFLFRERLFGVSAPESAINAGKTTDLPIVTDLGEDLFEDPRFTTLRDIETESPTPEQVGNEKPFTPY